MNNVNRKLVNYVKLKDLVNESILLSELTYYDCPEEEGQLYGYNPFTKKCVNITGYSGPERIEPIQDDPNGLDPVVKKDVDKPGYAPSILGGKELLVDVGNILTSWEKMGSCWKDHPLSTIGGLLLGGGGAHHAAVNGLFKTSLKAGVGAAKVAVKTVTFVAKVALLNIVSLAIAGGLYYSLRNEKKSFGWNITFGPLGRYLAPTWAAKIDETLEDVDKWTDINKDNVACFGASVIGSAALYATIRGGVIPGVKSLWRSSLRRSLSQRIGSSLSKAVKNFGKGTSNTSLFLLLKNEGKLGQDVGLKLVQKEGKSVLALTDDFAQIKIPVSELDVGAQKVFKKFIDGDDFVLDAGIINRELAEMSDEALVDTANIYTKEAREVTKSGSGRDLKRLMKMMSRDISTSAGARAIYFKETGKLFSGLIDESGPAIKSLYKDMLRLEKLEGIIGNKEIIRTLKSELIKSGDNIGRVANKAVQDGVIKASAKGEFLDYLKLAKEAAEKETKLAGDLAIIQRTLNEEGKFATTFGSAGKKTSDLNDFMSLPGADVSKLKKWNAELKLMLPTFGEYAAKASFRSVVSDLFLVGGVAGAIYVTSITKGFLDKSEIEVAAKPVNQLAGGFSKEITLKRYSEGRGPSTAVNVDKLLSDFLAFSEKVLSNKSKTRSESIISVLRKFTERAKTSEEVKNFYNDQERMRLSDQNLRTDFLTMIKEEFPQTMNEVKQMSKLDIRELVKEILNENSGQGYAKYPYSSSVRDEEQPKEDYIEDWKSLSLELVRDESRNTAIQLAKLLVKDLELFEDVLDLAGSNQSVGEEILRKLKEIREKA